MYKIKEKPEDFIVEEILDLKINENGRYSYFLLKKTNYNTEDALRLIADRLYIDRKRINYCGNKDKVAVTSQYVSVDNLTKEKRKNYEIGEISLEYKGQGDERLNLGSHEGNKFTIIVRDADSPKDVNKIKNLFGPQRFSNNNHLVGKEIVKGDFKKAVGLILENEGRYESEMKLFLQDNPNNHIGALHIIPKKIMSLYIHAYQGLLFNEMAKESEEEKLPLIGFGTDENSVKDILEKEGITTRDFIIRKFPEISSEGIERDLYMDLKDLKIEKIEEKTYKVSFFLGKGSYATVVIEAIFNEDNIN